MSISSFVPRSSCILNFHVPFLKILFFTEKPCIVMSHSFIFPTKSSLVLALLTKQQLSMAIREEFVSQSFSILFYCLEYC